MAVNLTILLLFSKNKQFISNFIIFLSYNLIAFYFNFIFFDIKFTFLTL